METEYEGNDILSIEADGTMKGGKFTGTVDVEIGKTKIITMEFTGFDIDAYKEGYPKGKVEIELGELAKQIVGGKYAQTLKPSLEINFNCSEKKSEIDIEVYALSQNVGSIEFTSQTMKAESISMPEDTVDDVRVWMQGFDLTKLEAILKKSGIPLFN